MSKSSIVEVNNISKKYYISRVPQASYTTLVETLSTQAREVLRKFRSRFDKSQVSQNNMTEEFSGSQGCLFLK